MKSRFTMLVTFTFAFLMIGAFAQQPINLSQVAGSAVTTGNGTNTGALRVTIASDSTGIVALTTGSSWIGNSQIGDGTHTVTLNSTTYTAKYGLDANLLGTLGTAFSTAGKVDIKAANGDVIAEIGDGTHTVTLASTTTSSKYGLDSNILSILGTGPTTAGKLD